MRLFSFLSRFTFICNIAFLFFIFFRWMELNQTAHTARKSVEAVPVFKNTVIVLGYSAIVINLIMVIALILLLTTGRVKGNLWLPLINFLFFLLQIYYFFFY